MTRNSHPVNPDFQQESDILISLAPNTTFESAVSVSPSYQHTLASRGGHKLLQPRPCRGKFSVWAVVSILSLVTVLAVLALCRTSQRRLDSGGAERRRLSDTEDDRELSEIVEQCLDLEQELGLQPAVVEHVEEASEAKSRLVGMLYDSAAAFENMNFLASQRLQDDDHSPPSKVPRLNGSPPSTSHPQEPVAAFLGRPSGVAVGDTGDALDADVRLESELVVDEVEHQRHTTGLQRGSSATAVQSSTFYAADAAARPSPSSFVSRADSAEEGVTPDAWLDESLAETGEQAFHQAVVGSASRYPNVGSASPAPTRAHSVGTFFQRAGRVDHQTRQADLGRASAVPSTPLTAVQHLEHSEQGFDARVDVSERSALPAVPGTSSEGGEPCDAGDICLHPFVRLPVVNPENIRRKFRKDFALVPCLGKASPMDSYMILRDLFSKPSLTAVDIDKLLQETEMLANYATTRLARTYGRCTASYLVRKLSTLFMLFDHLVCSIELLGENMDTPSWWPEFVRKFSTEYHLPLTGRTRRERELSRLVNRLSSALATYKEGKRPPFREIIELKRTIIAEASAESQLTNPLWELWVMDDREFCMSSRDRAICVGVPRPYRRRRS